MTWLTCITRNRSTIGDGYYGTFLRFWWVFVTTSENKTLLLQYKISRNSCQTFINGTQDLGLKILGQKVNPINFTALGSLVVRLPGTIKIFLFLALTIEKSAFRVGKIWWKSCILLKLSCISVTDCRSVTASTIIVFHYFIAVLILVDTICHAYLWKVLDYRVVLFPVSTRLIELSRFLLKYQFHILWCR